MMDNLLTEIQNILMPIFLAVATAFVGYLFNVVREWLGLEKSEANEEAIRRAAETEAGVLIKFDAIDDPVKLAAAAAKIIADLPEQVRDEEYDMGDIKDMILGAAGLIFPPAKILGGFLK
jgi:hypothetical protein